MKPGETQQYFSQSNIQKYKDAADKNYEAAYLKKVNLRDKKITSIKK